MAILLAIEATKASSIDRDDATTYGGVVTVQIGRVVLEFWATKKPS